MSTLTIVQGNNNDKDNTKAFMVKGEKGYSPTVSATKEGNTATITVTDLEGTDTVNIEDGFTPTVATAQSTGKETITVTNKTGTNTTTISDPVVTLSKSNHVATISVTDKNGTRTTTVADGTDLTDGAVPTGAIINFDGSTIPGGYEEVNGVNDYSTTEQQIGKWIDSKLLYRKVISISNPTIDSNSQVQADTISNVYEVTKIEGIMRSNSGFTVPVLTIWLDDISTRNSKLWADISSNTATIKYTLNSGWTSITQLTIVVEYTKTT